MPRNDAIAANPVITQPITPAPEATKSTSKQSVVGEQAGRQHATHTSGTIPKSGATAANPTAATIKNLPPGVERDAQHLLSALADRNLKPAGLLAQVVAKAGDSSEVHRNDLSAAIQKQLNSNVTPEQSKDIASRLGSKQFAQLKQAVGEHIAQTSGTRRMAVLKLAMRVFSLIEMLQNIFSISTKSSAKQETEAPIKKATQEFFNRYEEGIREHRGNLKPDDIKQTKLMENLQTELNLTSKEKKKNVTNEFRKVAGGANNIFIAGNDKPINGRSKSKTPMAGSSALLNVAQNNSESCLAASKVITVLQKGDTGRQILGNALANVLPMPNMAGGSADDLALGPRSHRFTVSENGMDGGLTIAYESSAAIESALSGEGSRQDVMKLDSFSSQLNLNAIITINGAGEVDIEKLAVDYQSLPILLEAGESYENPAADPAWNTNPASDIPAMPTPPPKGSDVKAAQLRGPSLQSLRQRWDAGVVARENTNKQIAATFAPRAPQFSGQDLRELSTDVCSAVMAISALGADDFVSTDETQQTINRSSIGILAAIGSPDSELRQLAFNRGLVEQEMNPQSRDNLRTKIGRAELFALEQELRNGIDQTSVANPRQTNLAMRNAAEQIAHIRTQLGVASTSPPISAETSAAANQYATQFAKAFSGGCETHQIRVENDNQARSLFVERSRVALDHQIPDQRYDFVSEDFLRSVHTTPMVVEGQRPRYLVNPNLPKYRERPDLVQHDAAHALLELCDNDPDKTLLLSKHIALATQDAVRLANVQDYTISEEFTCVSLRSSSSADEIRVEVHSQAQIESNAAGEATNPNFSSFDNSLRFSITDGYEMQFDGQLSTIRTAPYIAPVVVGSANYRAAMPLAHRESVERENLQNFTGIAANADLFSLDFDRNEVTELTENNQLFATKGIELLNRNVITELQHGQIEDRVEFIEDAQKEIENLVAEFEKTGENGEALMQHCADLVNDLDLIQEDLLIKADSWTTGNLSVAQKRPVNNILVAVGLMMSDLRGSIGVFTDEINAVRDDSRGDVAAVYESSRAHRAMNAVLQASAMKAAVGECLFEARINLVRSEHGNALANEIDRRVGHAQSYVTRFEDGEGIGVTFGPGHRKKKQSQEAIQNMEQQLALGVQLPNADPEMSEKELLTARVNHFLKENPEFAPHFANLGTRFANNIEDVMNAAPWKTISKRFYDNVDGAVHRMHSDITPAPRFQDAIFANTYGGKGVTAHSRMGGIHVSNLATTTLTDETANGEMFTGLRHGIVDAYTITPSKLAKQTDARLTELRKNTLAGDPEWQKFATNNSGGSVDGDIRLMRTDDGSKLAAKRARQIANHNAAFEMATAAVLTRPELLSQALAQGHVEVQLDSVSLVTPDILRDLIPGKNSEREMLANQREAFNYLSNNSPITITINDEKNIAKQVTVGVKVRSFNFGVNEYATHATGVKKLLKPLMGWAEADRVNQPLLEELVGPINSSELGGQAAAVVADPNSNARFSATDAGLPRAFDNPELRAATITKLSSEIKDIFASKAHRTAGNDPYKLVSRLTLISYLVGNSTAFNCKSGKDRTGQLDAEVKLLAASAVRNAMDAPNAVPDPARKTNYVLKTGNLEMQQYNSGLSGYKLIGIPSLTDNLNTSLARELFRGDSDYVST